MKLRWICSKSIYHIECIRLLCIRHWTHTIDKFKSEPQASFHSTSFHYAASYKPPKVTIHLCSMNLLYKSIVPILSSMPKPKASFQTPLLKAGTPAHHHSTISPPDLPPHAQKKRV